ncbi:CAAX amino protease [Hoyosella rhizosphaerae]|uniref:CAAX amino protease n=1 Tax=Hoyosella rhizosphaerae TaxID=1755582 RepID=A0A916XDU8_9ACTN|nr:CAAX amino protease [Hoyosella rhizosphaerae]
MVEVAIVLLVTLGLQGLYSLTSFAELLLAPTPLSEQSVALNVSRSRSEYIDLTRQLLGALRLFAWAALATYLLWRSGITAWLRSKLALSGRDFLHGIALAALIGLPGLGLYHLGRTLGITIEIVPAALDDHWWQIPALVVSAIANSAAEEIIVVAYLLIRLQQIGVGAQTAMLVSAVLRGTYHLYQGVGAFGGNIIMGLIFARYFQCTGRMWPLIIAHAVIDVVAFVGYTVLLQ